MKILSAGLLTAWIVTAAAKLHAQGTILLNNYDSRMGIFFNIGILIPASAATRVEVLAGPAPSSLTPIMAANGHGPVFEIPGEGVNALGPGLRSFFNEGSGVLLNVPPGGTVFLNVRAWTPAFDTWESADIRGESYVWSQQNGTADTPAVLALPRPIYLTLVDTPEPSSIALAALGVAGWLIFRPPKR